MAVTQSQLEKFSQYVTRQIELGGNHTLEDCLRMWQDEGDDAATIASIQRGIDDEAAGRMRPLAQVDAELRRKHGIQKDD